ncbi:nucleotide-binding protein [Xanthomonas arboricola pv. juglandis]|nr:Nucleotide-binding protein [Xanthomonas hortorum pv. vitians]SUZ36748.1 nucleotide-binding protein [Xanthomonas arboricola pv. juglandis]SYZ60495.1 nucleotide-binding protein [Xanthomonas arboricola pv. juglandis]
MIEVVRSEEEYRALADAALDRELERAKAGLTPAVSSKAAARFLGVHVDTLGQWRRRSPPLGPVFQKGGETMRAEPTSTFGIALPTWKSGSRPERGGRSKNGGSWMSWSARSSGLGSWKWSLSSSPYESRSLE